MRKSETFDIDFMLENSITLAQLLPNDFYVLNMKVIIYMCVLLKSCLCIPFLSRLLKWIFVFTNMQDYMFATWFD